MMQATVELEGQGPKPEIKSPTGFVLTGTSKMLLLVLVGMVLYFRLVWRRRKKERVCSHCGKRNPTHLHNCINCSAPLF